MGRNLLEVDIQETENPIMDIDNPRGWFVPSDSKGHIGHLWIKPTNWQREQPGWWVTITPDPEQLPLEEGETDG